MNEVQTYGRLHRGRGVFWFCRGSVFGMVLFGLASEGLGQRNRFDEHPRQDLLNKIESLGGQVSYNWAWKFVDIALDERWRGGAEGLSQIGALGDVDSLTLDCPDTRVLGPGLVRLRSLQRLDELTLNDTSLSDGSLAYLAGLDTLAVLSLERTRVTPSGAEVLWSLRSLKTILLDGRSIRRPGSTGPGD